MHLASRPPLARIMVIDQALRANAWPNARTLGDQLEVTPRTIRRDITYLRDQLCAPIEFDPVRNGYRYTESSFRLPYFQMNEGELVAVLLAERLLRQYQGTPFEPDLRRAFAKMTEMLPDSVSVQLANVADCLSVIPVVQTSYDPAVFATVARAAVCRRRIEMVYWTAGRNATTRRAFDPYHVALIDEGWYVIGHDYHRDEVLVFAMQRVRSVCETDATFNRPADFRVEDYLGGSFRVVRGDGCHRVVLRFSPEYAGRIAEKVWHPSQELEPVAGGGLILRFEISDLREVKRWVMFWGSDCEVLEPGELRESLTVEWRSLLRRYDRGTRRRERPASERGAAR